MTEKPVHVLFKPLPSSVSIIPCRRSMKNHLLVKLLLAAALIHYWSSIEVAFAQRSSSLPQAVAKVLPSVVQIITREISYDIVLRPVVSRALASGVIFDSRGHILTNSHVVGKAKEITVVLPDGRTFAGKVMGKDQVTDLAVIMIEGVDFPYSTLGDSSALQVGETVVAIGNAFGLDGGPAVTVGVVSALNRSIEDPEWGAMTDLIQTDAAINPGNSGGPLVNLRGEVVGINTAIIPSGHGVGFAITINSAKPVADKLLKEGKIARAWLGVHPLTIHPVLAVTYKLPVSERLIVTRIEKGSPAEAAGIKAGDIITTIDGGKIKNLAALHAELERRKAGEKLSVEVYRNKKLAILSVTLGNMPEEP